MAFSTIVAVLYVSDILYCTVIDSYWGIGMVKWENFLSMVIV